MQFVLAAILAKQGKTREAALVEAEFRATWAGEPLELGRGTL
jgi:hypothetical protein